jgi:hypothetical protein
MNILLIKIILGALLIGVPVVGLVYHFKHDRANMEALGAANERIAQLEATLALRDGEITSLNHRIEWRNEQALAEVAAAEKAQAQARIEADKARADKVRLAGQLQEAQRKYKEALNSDEKVQSYSITVVPPAVLDRLRSANGEAGYYDTLSPGYTGGGENGSDTSRTVAWLHLPYAPAQRIDK